MFIDFIVIMSFFIFMKVLRDRQEEFIAEFQMQKIQMRDFTVRVKYLPNDLKFEDNEHVLKADLINHFEKVLMIMEKSRKDTRDTQTITRYDIADISFGKTDIDDTIKLVDLHEYYMDVKRLKTREIILAKNPKLTNFSEDVRDAEETYKKERNKIFKRVKNLQDRVSSSV